MELSIQRCTSDQLKQLPADSSQLGFGRLFTDHMLTMRYKEGTGWHDPRIEPYAPFSLDPATIVFHYGQEIFEGAKAYAGENGSIRFFRTDANVDRMNRSCRRMCMPELPKEFVLDAIQQLVQIDARWVPTDPGTALYIRPTMIATDPFLGVRAADTYLFYVILSPVGAYYSKGFNPVRLMVMTDLVRAAEGGTGEAKCGGNYAGTLLAGRMAREKGCDQVLWLDAKEHKYAEEVGAMNIWFAFGKKLVTAPLGGTILPGVTRMSLLELAPTLGYEVEERRISIDEIRGGLEDGSLTEIFGSGTAAVISPVGELMMTDGSILPVSGNEVGPIAKHLYDELTGLQTGRKPDPFGWIQTVDAAVSN